MKVIFDSNIWQNVVIPENFPDDIFMNDFKKIKKAIIDKKMEPFLSETIFTIEAIQKKERQNFFSSIKAKIETKEFITNDNEIGLNFSLSPEKGIDFNERPILKKYFDEAIKMGFNIVSLPRIGGMVNEDIENVRFRLENDELSKYHEKVFEVARKIESNGSGISQIKDIGLAFNSQKWMDGLRLAPETEWKKISKAAAEWADGDSVAICVALGCNYFCTRDQAKGAGSKSVLSQNNLEWLKKNYNFETILPEELTKLLC